MENVVGATGLVGVKDSFNQFWNPTVARHSLLVRGLAPGRPKILSSHAVVVAALARTANVFVACVSK